MDCQTFDSSLLDAIYDEIDAPTSTAMDEHASGCASCAANIARLKKTRSLIRPALEASLPEGLEARILAATPSAMDAPKATAKSAQPVVSIAERRGIVAFLSKPQFAIAAAFILVLGATTIFLGSSAEKAAPMAASMPASEQSPAKASEDQPAPTGVPMATATAPVVGAAASAIAMAEPASPPAALARKGSPRGLDSDAKEEKAKTADPAFDAAKSLYDGGRYAEALPKFQALAANSPEAELYVARCLVQTKSCAAADPHFDSAARRSGGENASRARLEAARCYKNAGQAVAAKTRYSTLTADPYVANEANTELADLATSKASVRAGPAAPAAPAATIKPPAAKPASKVDVGF
jgi:hypothetical protein